MVSHWSRQPHHCSAQIEQTGSAAAGLPLPPHFSFSESCVKWRWLYVANELSDFSENESLCHLELLKDLGLSEAFSTAAKEMRSSVVHKNEK